MNGFENKGAIKILVDCQESSSENKQHATIWHVHWAFIIIAFRKIRTGILNAAALQDDTG
jgi:hypothetical protein